MDNHENTITATKGFFIAALSLFAGETIQHVNDILQMIVLILGAVSGLIGVINGINKRKK